MSRQAEDGPSRTPAPRLDPPARPDGRAGDPGDLHDLHDAVTRLDGLDEPVTAGPVERAPTWPGGLQRLGDRYQLEEPIASGGAAVVWRAFDDVLSRSVAIKLLHPHLATDPTTVERFRLESINAARLTHPNVVAIYDTGQQQDIVYLVMEFVDGSPLRDLIHDGGPLDPTAVAALGEQVASALGEAHGLGVVHRDVKPANILVNRDGVVKVTDFGIAKALSGDQASLTNPGTVVGTAAYVAPEQLEGRSVDARADVYSLGVVLYEALVGEPAFQGDTPAATAAARLTRDLLPPRQVRADVPRALDDVIVRATQRDPDLRYEDGAAMASALAPLVRARPSDVTAALLARETTQRQPVAADPEVAGARSRDFGRRVAAVFLGSLLLALIAFLGTRALRVEVLAPEPIEGAERLTIVAAGDLDPGSADGQEHPDQVARAHDGDLNTSWTTEVYRDPLPDLKPGVGIWFDLGEPQPVERIVLDTDAPGSVVRIHATDERPPSDAPDLAGWGRPIVDDVAIASAELIDVDGTARYWLVWISAVPEVEPGQWQGGFAEVRFLAAAEA